MSSIPLIGAEQGVNPAEVSSKTEAKSTTGFGDMLGKALSEVDSLQTQGDVQSNAVAHGAGNLHELALSLEKADVAMRVAVKVRNKLLDAYNEVMRMTV